MADGLKNETREQQIDTQQIDTQQIDTRQEQQKEPPIGEVFILLKGNEIKFYEARDRINDSEIKRSGGLRPDLVKTNRNYLSKDLEEIEYNDKDAVLKFCKEIDPKFKPNKKSSYMLEHFVSYFMHNSWQAFVAETFLLEHQKQTGTPKEIPEFAIRYYGSSDIYKEKQKISYQTMRKTINFFVNNGYITKVSGYYHRKLSDDGYDFEVDQSRCYTNRYHLTDKFKNFFWLDLMSGVHPKPERGRRNEFMFDKKGATRSKSPFQGADFVGSSVSRLKSLLKSTALSFIPRQAVVLQQLHSALLSIERGDPTNRKIIRQTLEIAGFRSLKLSDKDFIGNSLKYQTVQRYAFYSEDNNMFIDWPYVILVVDKENKDSPTPKDIVSQRLHHNTIEMKREARPMLKINGNPVAYLDYNANNLRILKTIKGLPITRKDEYCISAISLWKDKNAGRDYIKKFAVISISTATETEARRRIGMEVGSGYLTLPENTSAEETFNAVKDSFGDVAQYFYGGAWKECIVKETYLGCYVVGKMAQEGRVVFPIYDGFMCESKNKLRLREVMEEAYKVVLHPTAQPLIKENFDNSNVFSGWTNNVPRS